MLYVQCVPPCCVCSCSIEVVSGWTTWLAMAYEALIVIGFGVSLAVVSVALFVAHVKRINAPNRADPSGIVVHIDLGSALAKDEATRNRKLASRRSATKELGGNLGGGTVPGAFALQQNGVGRRRRRPCAASGGGEEGQEDIPEVNDATSTQVRNRGSKTEMQDGDTKEHRARLMCIGAVARASVSIFGCCQKLRTSRSPTG